MSGFDLDKFLVDVFDPAPGENAAVLVDRPRPGVHDNDAWRERRAMAARWRDGLAALGERRGFTTLPLVTFPSAGTSGAPFPPSGECAERTIDLGELLDASSLVLALTEHSMTAALVDVCKRRAGAAAFRAASMPGVQAWMEATSLAADYAEVAKRCRRLVEAFRGAEHAEVVFSTGHRCRFDLRHRVCESDDGYLHRDKSDDIPVINLPSGETFQVPYEGEIDGDPSRTSGELPVHDAGETIVLRVDKNRIVEVQGRGAAAERHRAFFDADPMRANVAEVAFGCNERARVTGNVLEDEKAGFHWAYGRSDHLGGKVGLADFKSPAHVVHHDVVYAKGSPITVARADLVAPDGRRTAVIEGGEYRLW